MSTLGKEQPGADGDESSGVVTSFGRRAPRISQADVFRAADELLVQGDRPTIDRVRMRLGRGSPNTINDHLDAWWAKLGARLRDVPGQEFPQLPERVAQSLQHLWNEALEGAHNALQETLAGREHSVRQRDEALIARARQLDEREQTMAARALALEEGLALARDQLVAGNRRAERLEATLQEREAECSRLRVRIEALEGDATDLRTKLETTNAGYQAARTRLEERHTAAEARWLLEVDRARQTAKETARKQEQQIKDLRGQIERLRSERDERRQELHDARSELKAGATVRQQLEERLRKAARRSAAEPAMARSKGSGPQKRPGRRIARSTPKQ
ncbi:MAG: hypothetical protein JWL65_705 [Gammaproteobacteria bacterium]|nr:hypothetical protein [Gammaproteobacteria bacterium]